MLFSKQQCKFIIVTGYMCDRSSFGHPFSNYNKIQYSFDEMSQGFGNEKILFKLH